MTSEEGKRLQAINGVTEKCSKALSKINTFYNDGIVNSYGSTFGVPYTEIVAGFLLRHLEKLNEIPMITRNSSYDSGHKGEFNPKSNQTEQIDAIKMFNQCKATSNATIGEVGCIIDYQVPLKDKLGDKAGTIDLLSKSVDTVYVLELKREKSKETLLRCILEGYTYLRTVNKEKLFNDFGLDLNMQFKTAPLIYKDSLPYVEYEDMINGNRPKLLALMKKLDVDLFVLKNEAGKYTAEKRQIDI